MSHNPALLLWSLQMMRGKPKNEEVAVYVSYLFSGNHVYLKMLKKNLGGSFTGF